MALSNQRELIERYNCSNRKIHHWTRGDADRNGRGAGNVVNNVDSTSVCVTNILPLTNVNIGRLAYKLIRFLSSRWRANFVGDYTMSARYSKAEIAKETLQDRHYKREITKQTLADIGRHWQPLAAIMALRLYDHNGERCNSFQLRCPGERLKSFD